MQKLEFKVSKMDCAAEENLVRMILDRVEGVEQLSFDLSARRLTVFHEGEPSTVERAVAQLNLGSRLLKTEPVSRAEMGVREASSHAERKVLWAVLLINAAFFVVEAAFGLLSGSVGLVADSLDMLADATVYALSLAAVGAAFARKRTIAKASGYFQLFLAGLGFLEIVRRSLGFETPPNFQTMIVVSLFALVANGACLYLLQRSQSQEVHMKASMIFTSNDVVINLGVIVAGLLVAWLNSGIPDLVVGAVVFFVVIQGALRILKLAE